MYRSLFGLGWHGAVVHFAPMDQVARELQNLMLHPYTGFVFTLILSALSLSGRLSVSAAKWLLLVAWLLATFSLARWQPIVNQPLWMRLALIGLCSSAVAVAFLLLSAWMSTPRISIQPQVEIILHSGTWANKTTITIANNGYVPVYSVWVKIWTESQGVASEDIAIQPTEDDPHAPLVRIENDGQIVEIRSDVIMFNFIDSQNREAVLVRFYQLAENKSRHLMVSGKAALKSSAFVKMLGFKPEPDKVLTQPKKAAFLFQVPESGTLKSLRFKTGELKLR